MKAKIKALLNARNAIMLAHNYQPGEIQDIADLCGDSLELSIKAANTDADVILFCGVTFMAETASILSPQKTVLLPRKDAGCPMADMVTAPALAQKKAALPAMEVVTYVNSSAAVKALSTVCCTSANAVDIVNSLDGEEVLMVPDKNLARYVASRTSKKIHFWDGYCPVHAGLTAQAVLATQRAFPEAEFLAHPECPPPVLELADQILSTSGMIGHVSRSDNTAFIIGTEIGLLYPLKKRCPRKTFIPASKGMECADMKKISLADIIKSLESMAGEVKVAEEIRRPAFAAVSRMLALAK